MGKQILTHHAVVVLPFYSDKFIFEQKDKGYKPPFFEKGLNFLGGNWKKGINPDKKLEEVICRELREEFWMQYENPQSLNSILGETFLKRKEPNMPDITKKYDELSVKKIQQVGNIFEKDIIHASDYVVTVNPPIMKNKLDYGLSVFLKELTKEEFKIVQSVFKGFKGKITTDNLKWDTKLECITLDKINKQNRKFSWGYDHVLNDLIELKLISHPLGMIRTMNLVEIKRIQHPGNSFKDFESSNFRYVTV